MHFAQRELPFPDARSEQELARAILDYTLIAATEFTDVRGQHVTKPAKTFSSISLYAGSNIVTWFRHALFVLSKGEYEGTTKRSIENALLALDELADIYQRHAAHSRKQANKEFLDTPAGPVGRHNADMTADINDAETFSIIAGKLRTDIDLRTLVKTLADKLSVTLKTNNREI